MKKMTRLMGIATVVLATGLANAESPAMKSVETKSETVSFSRAEAQTTEGAQALYMRLRVAAKNVCGERSAADGVASWGQPACASSALGSAVREINVPALSTLHGNRGTVEVLVAR
jgi:UrcA family protein